MEENKEPPKENLVPSQQDEIKALREQIEALKSAKQEQSLSESLNKKIEELVEQRLNDKEKSERQRIEEARRMIEEAEKNAALEEELRKNEKYNRLTNWKENLLEEFKREINKLRDMGERNQHSVNMYRDYDFYNELAAHNDRRGTDALGVIKMTHAAMNLGGEKLANIFKKNIGVVE